MKSTPTLTLRAFQRQVPSHALHVSYMYVHVFMFYRLNHSCHSKYAKWEHEEYRHVYACKLHVCACVHVLSIEPFMPFEICQVGTRGVQTCIRMYVHSTRQHQRDLAIEGMVLAL
jgi:hypothetical protein